MSTVTLPPHISYSQVSTYLTCGEQFRLERVVRAPSRPTWAAVGGSAVHAATEAHDLALFGSGASLSELTFSHHFEIAKAEAVERSGFTPEEWKVTGRASKDWPEKEGERWWLHHGPIFCARWQAWSSNCGWDIWVTDEGVPAIELGLQPTFGGILDKMFIDRVFTTSSGDLVVVDLKTGSRTPPSPEQLGDYATGMEQVLGRRPKYGTFWMARTGGTTTVEELDGHTREAVDHRYSLARKGMEAGVFVAHPSNMCGSCGVRDACYAVAGKDAADYAPFPLTQL